MTLVRGGLRACLCCLLALGLPARAAPSGWVAVDAAALERQRGGFTTPGGLVLSIGIERLVAINGQVLARTSVQLANLNGLGAQQLQQTGAALSAVKLIQNGTGNMEHAAFADATLGGTIIQNTLSGQRIESRTIINASVNSLGLLKALNFNGSVSDAIARAAGPR